VRIVLLLAYSADGTVRLPPLVIGKSENPHSFKNVRKLPTKYVANRKAWITHAIFTDYLRALDAKMSSRSRKLLVFVDPCAAYSGCRVPKNAKVMFVPPNCISIFQLLDQGISTSFKHYYCKQLVRKIISVIDHKLLHDALTMKVNVLDAQHFIVESWCSLTNKQTNSMA
jgi:hypothetical protein